MLYYLGMDIKLMRNVIFLSQSKYTKKIIIQIGFADAYEVSRPMEPGMITNKLVNDKELKNKPYREAIGSLLYLSTMSRPDISFSVNYIWVVTYVNQKSVTGKWLNEYFVICKALKGLEYSSIATVIFKFTRIQIMQELTQICVQQVAS